MTQNIANDTIIGGEAQGIRTRLIPSHATQSLKGEIHLFIILVYFEDLKFIFKFFSRLNLINIKNVNYLQRNFVLF